MTEDPNYRVEGVPTAIRAKITQLMNASREAAFAGAQEPDVADMVRDYELICRMELEQTINTHLERRKRK